MPSHLGLVWKKGSDPIGEDPAPGGLSPYESGYWSPNQSKGSTFSTESTKMRKDVKRSLVLWPGLASGTIVLVFLIALGQGEWSQWTRKQFSDAWAAMNGPVAPEFPNPGEPSPVASPTTRELAAIEQYSDAPLAAVADRAPLRSLPKVQDSSNTTAAEKTVVEITAEPMHASVPAPLVYPMVERTEPNSDRLAPPPRVALLKKASSSSPPSNRPQLQADTGNLIEDTSDTAGADSKSSSEKSPADKSSMDTSLQLRPPTSESWVLPNKSTDSISSASRSSNVASEKNAKTPVDDVASLVIDTDQLFADFSAGTQTATDTNNATRHFSDESASGASTTNTLAQPVRTAQEKITAPRKLPRSAPNFSQPMAPDPIDDDDHSGADGTAPGFDSLVERIARKSVEEVKPEPENRVVPIDAEGEHARQPALDNPATWPVATTLTNQLRKLAQWEQRRGPAGEGQFVSSRTSSGSSITRWSNEVESHLEQLRLADRLGDDRSGIHLKKLQQLSVQGAKAAEQLTDRNQQIAWLRAAYAVNRRVAVWTPVWRLSNQPAVADAAPSTTPADVQSAIASAKNDLATTGDLEGWADYLMLDQLDRAADSDDAAFRAIVARRVLTRMQYKQLGAVQRAWIQRPSLQELGDSIRPWSRTPVDYAALLKQIEKMESKTIDLVKDDIAETMQALRFADHQAAMDVSTMIDTHYRNANVRVALSTDFLQRLIPEIPSRSMPVRTRMLGSQVTGMSDIDSDLSIRLVPARDRWSILLQTIGNVRTRSTGRKGPAAISTLGANQFVASTPIQISSTGATVGGSSVDVSGRTRLRGVRTTYDGWPLLGDLVRSFAEGQYEEQSGIAQRLANRRVEKDVTKEIDRSVNDKVNELSDRFSEMVLGPLNQLDLEPQVIDMETTEDRLIARYRMANELQLAAFTPRPRAPSESIMSVQVHQSALNNTMQQMIVQQEPTPLPEIMGECMSLLGIENVGIPDDIPSDVRIRFAKHRPITFEVTEGKVWLTMRVILLERGDRMKLSNFIVRAAYRPQIQGLSAVLVREGHLSISGPGMSMRERLPVRAIFNKVLSSTRSLPLTSQRLAELPGTEGLVINQLELRDGWLSIAVGPTVGETPQPSTYISDDRIANRQE